MTSVNFTWINNILELNVIWTPKMMYITLTSVTLVDHLKFYIKRAPIRKVIYIMKILLCLNIQITQILNFFRNTNSVLLPPGKDLQQFRKEPKSVKSSKTNQAHCQLYLNGKVAANRCWSAEHFQTGNLCPWSKGTIWLFCSSHTTVAKFRNIFNFTPKQSFTAHFLDIYNIFQDSIWPLLFFL